MFRGINTVSLDNKGRLAIPSKYRDILEHFGSSEQLIATIDTEEACLLLYPLNYWEEIEQKVSMLPSFNVQARRIQRLLIGHATEVMLDSQSRILLPQELRKYAGLAKKVILVGQSKKIEIWDPSKWEEKRDLWLTSSKVELKELSPELQTLSL